MKHNFKITIIVALLAIFIFQSCKKENIAAKPKQPENLEIDKVDPNSVLSKIKVNENGYLVFSSRNDLVEYDKLMNSSNRDLVLSSLHSKGFTKKANSMLFSKDEDDPYDVYFDQDGLMQVEDILIKISSNEKFLYIIKEQNLDPELYSKLISEVYDELKMDKINVDRLEEDFDLLGIVDYTPFGINEPENTSEDKRPMFGSSSTDCGLHSNATCIWEECTVHHYAFWILTSTQENHVTAGSMNCVP